MGARVSQVKPSNCFRLHSTSMISKHSTIPVPDSLLAPRKISFTFYFWHKSFVPDDVKLVKLSNNSFEWKNVTFYEGSNRQNILRSLLHIFRGSQDSPTPRIYAPAEGTSCRRAAAMICPAPLLPLWAPKRLASPSTAQLSSSFPRPIRSHAHRCSCLTR